jgi:glycosyltransferase involved in cell wall biosynthesis
MLISVVVPLSRGRLGTRLRNCLMGIRRCQPPPTAEIILSLLHPKGENTERDLVSLKPLADQVQARIVVTENPHEAWGPSLVRNAGFRVATGAVVASLDADAVLHPNTLRLAMEHGKQGRATRAATVMRPEGPSSFVFKDASVFEKYNEGPVAPGPGSFISAPRKVIEKLRGWDEAYVGYGCADHDWIARLEQAGCKVVNIGSYALHQHHARKATKDIRKAIERNRERFALTKEGELGTIRNPDGWGGRP